MAAIDTAEVHNILNAMVGKVAYVPVLTTPSTSAMRLRLYTVIGTDAAAGTEVTGGSYAAQTLDFANAPATRAIGNSAAEAFTLMPACTVVAVELWDTTPTRKMWGALAANKTVAAGDTLSFAIGSVIISFA
jgi:hypothetical protein